MFMPRYLCFFTHFYGDQATQRDFNKNLFFYYRSYGVATSDFVAVILILCNANMNKKREFILCSVKVRFRLAMTVRWPEGLVLTLLIQKSKHSAKGMTRSTLVWLKHLWLTHLNCLWNWRSSLLRSNIKRTRSILLTFNSSLGNLVPLFRSHISNIWNLSTVVPPTFVSADQVNL